MSNFYLTKTHRLYKVNEQVGKPTAVKDQSFKIEPIGPPKIIMCQSVRAHTMETFLTTLLHPVTGRALVGLT
jgi:hypothetical protein